MEQNHNQWCGVTLQVLLLDNNRGKKQLVDSRQRCQSNSRRRDDWRVLSVQCVFPTCCNDKVTSLFFLFFYATEISISVCCLRRCGSVSTWWYNFALWGFISSWLLWLLLLWQFLRFSFRTCREKRVGKKKKTISDRNSFSDPLHVLITRKMCREKKKRG